jgi:hypothetical protein
LVALEDVLGRRDRSERIDGEEPANDPVADSSGIVFEREEWQRMAKQLQDTQRTHDELGAALERATSAESERDLLRVRLSELQRRVELLEHGRSTIEREQSQDPASSTDDEVPTLDVEVEWRPTEEPSPSGSFRRWRLRRRGSSRQSSP